MAEEVSPWLAESLSGDDPDNAIRQNVLTPMAPPEQAAADISLAGRVGQKPEVVSIYRDLMQGADRQQEVDDHIAKAPGLRPFLADPDNYAVAHDDLPQLSWWGNLQATGENMLDALNRKGDYKVGEYKGVFDNQRGRTGAETRAGLVRDYQIGEEHIELAGLMRKANPAIAAREGRSYELTPDEQKRVGELRESVKDKGAEIWGLSPAAQNIPMVFGAIGRGLEFIPGRAKETWTSITGERFDVNEKERRAGASEFDINKPIGADEALFKLGFAAPLSIGAGIMGAYEGINSFTYELESGLAYDEFMQMRAPDGRPASEIVGEMRLGQVADQIGAVNATIEAVGLAAFAKIVGIEQIPESLGKLAAMKQVKEVLQRKLLTEAAATLAGRAVAAGIEEGITEGLQETAITNASSDILEEIGAPVPTFGEQVARVLDASYHGFQAGVVLGGIGSSPHFAADLQSINESQRVTQMMDEMGKQSTSSKLRQRLPEKYAQAVEIVRASQGGPLQNMPVDAEKFAEHFESQGIDPYTVAHEVGVLREQLDQALAAGGTVDIPIGQYAAKIAPTPHHEAMWNNARILSNGMTPAEMARIPDVQSAWMKQADQIRREVDDRAAHAESEGKVYDAVLAEFQKSGAAIPEAAKMNAKMAAAFWTVTASKMGVDPWTAYSERQVDVRTALVNPEGDAPAPDMLEQGGRFVALTPEERVQKYKSEIRDWLLDRAEGKTPNEIADYWSEQGAVDLDDQIIAQTFNRERTTVQKRLDAGETKEAIAADYDVSEDVIDKLMQDLPKGKKPVLREAIERLDAQGLGLSPAEFVDRLRGIDGLENTTQESVRAVRSRIRKQQLAPLARAVRRNEQSLNQSADSGGDLDMFFIKPAFAGRAVPITINQISKVTGILHYQKRNQEPQTVRYAIARDGTIYIWDGNQAIHNDVAEALKVPLASLETGEINDPRDMDLINSSIEELAGSGNTPEEIAELRSVLNGVDAGDGTARPPTMDEIYNTTIMKRVDVAAKKVKPTLSLKAAADIETLRGRSYTVDGKTVGFDAAVDNLIATYSDIPGGVAYDRQAFFILGYPGAGKSTYVKEISKEFHAAAIDADVAKELVPGYENGVGSQKVHNESSALRNAAQAKMELSGANIIVERIGDNQAVMERTITELNERGYSVYMIHVGVSPDEAVRRATERYLENGRFIPPSSMEKMVGKVLPVIETLTNYQPLKGYADINAEGPRETATITRQGGESQGLARAIENAIGRAVGELAADGFGGSNDPVRNAARLRELTPGQVADLIFNEPSELNQTTGGYDPYGEQRADLEKRIDEAAEILGQKFPDFRRNRPARNANSRRDAEGDAGKSDRAGRGGTESRTGTSLEDAIAKVTAASSVKLTKNKPNAVARFGQYQARLDAPVEPDKSWTDTVYGAFDSYIEFDILRTGRAGVAQNGPRGAVQIKWSTTAIDVRDTGLGKFLYRQFLDWAFSEGRRVFSDHTLSPASQILYGQKFREYGYEVVFVAEDAAYDDTGWLRSASQKPLFEVRPTATPQPYAHAPMDGLKIGGPSLRQRLADNAPRALNQSGDVRKASIIIPDFTQGLMRGERALVLMREASDLSSFMHEFGHYALAVYQSLANEENAPQAIVDDFAKIRKWMATDESVRIITRDANRFHAKRLPGSGRLITANEVRTVLAGSVIADRDVWQASHELFARTFEAYLLEGKSPSLELKQVFQAFKEWLRVIYKTVLSLDANLNAEIRDVLDRMVASEDQIAEVQKLDAQGLMTREQFPGTDNQWNRYQLVAARAKQEAEDDLRIGLMDTYMRAQKASWARQKAAMRQTVERDIDEAPERRAFEWLAYGRWKGDVPRKGVSGKDLPPAWGPITPPADLPAMAIDTGAVVDDYGADALAALPVELKPLDKGRVDGLLGEVKEVRKNLKRKAPRTLVQAIKDLGGIKDDTGDVLGIIGRKQDEPGLINAAGRDLDNIIDPLWEQGYFGPGPGRYRGSSSMDQRVWDALTERWIQADPEYSSEDAPVVEGFVPPSSLDDVGGGYAPRAGRKDTGPLDPQDGNLGAGAAVEYSADAGFVGGMDERARRKEMLAAAVRARKAKPTELDQIDMNEARLARAQAQGFDTSKVWYHSSLGEITQFAPTGKFMGRHGVSGISLTDNPEMANRYLDRYAEIGWVDGVPNQPFQKNVMAYFVRAKNIKVIEKPIGTNLKMGYPLPADYKWPKELDGYDAVLVKDAINGPDKVKGSDAQLLADLGYENMADGVMHTSVDDPGAIVGMELILRDPQNIRSVNANFDENKTSSLDTLDQTGYAPTGYGVGSITLMAQLDATKRWVERHMPALTEDAPAMRSQFEAELAMAQRGARNDVWTPARIDLARQYYQSEQVRRQGMGEIERRAVAAGVRAAELSMLVEINRKVLDGPVALDQMAGVRALTANEGALREAQDMVGAGASREEVWRKTGWAVGDDGQWRFEIDTGEAKLIVPLAAVRDSSVRLLDEVIDFPGLFEAYPQLRGVMVDMARGNRNGGWWARNEPGAPVGVIHIRVRSEARARSVLLHEIQHAIQDIEGFATGGDWTDGSTVSAAPMEFRRMVDEYVAAEDKRTKGAPWRELIYGDNDAAFIAQTRQHATADVKWKLYWRLSGEVEARDVEFRATLDKETRRNLLPMTGAADQVEAPDRIVFLANPGDAFSSAEPPARVESVGLDQLAQQNTPEFKAWFGNSKVVDADGKPLRMYHGSGNIEGLDKFDPNFTGQGNDQIGSGFYFSNKPSTASNYTSARISFDKAKLGGEESPGVVPVYLSIQKPITLRDGANNLSDVGFNLTAAQAAKIISAAPDIRNVDETPIGNWHDVWGAGGVTDAMIRDVAKSYVGPNLISLENDFFRGSEGATEFRKALNKVLGYDGVIMDFGNGEIHAVAWFPEQIKSAIGNRGTFDPNDPVILNQLDNRPSVQDLLDAIAQTHNGDPVFSQHDEDLIQERNYWQDQADWLDKNGIDINANAATIRTQIQALLDRDNASKSHPDDIAYEISKHARPKADGSPAFSSGSELLKALAAIKPRRQAIEAELNARMIGEYGDPMKDGSLMNEARAAAHAEMQGRKIEVELEAIERASGSKRVVRGVARDAAKAQLQNMTIRQIKNADWFLAAERRSAQAAVLALETGDWREAAFHKQRQLLNFWLYREAKDAGKKIERSEARWKRLAESPNVRGKIDADYLDKIDALLEGYELRKSYQSHRQGWRNQELIDWVAEMEASGNGDLVAIDPAIIAAAGRRQVNSLRLSEFDGLRDTIANLEHLGRLKDKLLAQQEQRSRDAAVEGMVERAETEWPNRASIQQSLASKTPFERVKEDASDLFGMLTKAEYMFRYMDGLKDGGPWMRTFLPAVQRAESKRIEMMEDYTEKFNELISVYDKKELGRMLLLKKWVPEINDNITKMQMLTVALYSGTAYRKDVLLQGFNWTPSQHKAVLDNLDERDWAFVQSIWDYVELLWPETVTLHRKMTGTTLKKDPAVPVQTVFGTYAGGYFPIVYNSELSDTARKRENKDLLEGKTTLTATFRKAATNIGRTKELKGSGGQALSLDLISILAKHVDDAVHDITHREVIYDVNKLIADPRILQIVRKVLGGAGVDVMERWAKSLGKQPIPVDGFEKIMSRARRNIAAVQMGWNIKTATLQFLSATQAVPRNGIIPQLREMGVSVSKDYPEFLANQFRRLFGAPQTMPARVQFVLDRSEYMKFRIKTAQREINEASRKRVGTEAGGLPDIPPDVRESYFMFIQLLDMGVSVPTWLAAYETALGGRVDNIAQGDEAAAIDHADSVIRMTMGASAPKDLSYFMSAPNLKIWTMFMGWASTFYNQVFMEQLPGVIHGKISKARFAANMLFIWFIPAAITELMYGRMENQEGEDDDDKWRRVALEIMIYPLQGIPLIRDATNAFATGYDYAMSPVQSAIEAPIKMAEYAGSDPLGPKLLKSAFMTLGYAIGVPSKALWRAADEIGDVISGEDDLSDPADSAAELLWQDKR